MDEVSNRFAEQRGRRRRRRRRMLALIVRKSFDEPMRHRVPSVHGPDAVRPAGPCSCGSTMLAGRASASVNQATAARSHAAFTQRPAGRDEWSATSTLTTPQRIPDIAGDGNIDGPQEVIGSASAITHDATHRERPSSSRPVIFPRRQGDFHSTAAAFLIPEFRRHSGSITRQSVGRTGIGYENPMAESFFAALKNERVHRTQYPTREHARRDVVRYIEFWYNSRRRHSGLQYRTPQQVRNEYLERKNSVIPWAVTERAGW